MKCRLPAEAWPATPGRKPCLPSSAWMSRAPSAMRSGGTQTSSMISAVPGGRSRPISPCIPSRTDQTSSTRSWSRVQSASLIRRVARRAPRPPSPRAHRARRRRRRRTPPAAPPTRAGSSRHSSGVPGIEWLATISDGATISSTAVAPAATKSGTGRHGGLEARRSGARTPSSGPAPAPSRTPPPR